MSKTQWKLLASSGTKEGLHKLACEFWLRSDISLDESGQVTIGIAIYDDIRWVKKSGRYRLEMKVG